MNLRAAKALIAIAVSLVSSSLPENTWTVREDGVGPVKVGMSLSEINIVLREKFSPPEQVEDRGCFFVSSQQRVHISFMLEASRLVRVDVSAAGVPTLKGIQVGDSEAHALEVYGKAMKIEPNAYSGPEDHYLTVHSSGSPYGIRFETEKAKIRTYYAGLFKAVQYIEGCQ